MLKIPKIKAKKGQEKQIKALNFLIRLLVWAIPLYIILIFDLSLPQLQYAVANIVTYLLNLAGMHPVLNDLFISIPIKDGSWGAFINWDCTAWKSMLAFLALVMAVDKGKKVKGLILFIPLIFIVNILRIFFMFYFVKTYDLAYFEIVHTLIWSWGLIFTVLIFWIIWLKSKHFTS
ncbi:MAG: exosortase/archaeosortase family protein [Candidatus Aenigmarchaeota archaeon]|nr:exosortase/archaeosortase family protein [Candidatus Aenigmarchaeota archaeon]